MPEFTRFTETITKKQDKRVVNISVKPTVIDCIGSVWFTDLMLQEGDKVTGFVINTGTLLEKYDGDDATTGKRFYNGIVRSAATCRSRLQGLSDSGNGRREYFACAG